MSDFRGQLRQGLLDSYKHRVADGNACAKCGKTDAPLAFHVLEASFNEGEALPQSFVSMSSSNGRIRGSYPICSSCAPPCKKCQVPVPTEKVLEFGSKLNAQTGNGLCGEHIYFGLFFLALFKRLFNIGRFSKKT